MISSYRLVMFLVLFAVPLAIYSFYELMVTTDQYHSDATIYVTRDNAAASPIDLSLLGISTTSGSQDGQTLVTFMLSPEMLQLLENSLKLREHYSNPDIDWWSRLPPHASREDFHDYMMSFITVVEEPTSGLIDIHVRAFSRDFANSVARTLLKEGQQFVDRLNASMTEDKTRYFKQELGNSEHRVREARAKLLAFQRENRLLTADSEAAMISSTISNLNTALISKKGQLEIEKERLNDSSPVIRALRTEIKTLEEQIKTEKDRLSVGTSQTAVSELSAQFAEIKANLEFVELIFKSNLAQLEAARTEATKRLKYLIVVIQPSLADASLYPDRLYNIITAVIILFAAFFIASLMVAIVREHA